MKTGYLIDTSVISILAPNRPELTPELAAWVRGNQAQLHISVMTILEIEQCIRKLVRKNAIARAQIFRTWLADLEEAMDDNILDLDREIARRAAFLIDETVSAGWQLGYPDILIGATAFVHDMPILTRNLRHFRAMNIDCLDPVEVLPE